jgi:hypothetical protein
MNTTFLPVGTDLPTGAVTVMLLGRCIAWATTCWAAATLALPEVLAALLPLALLDLLDDPHAAARIATATLSAVRATTRRTRLRADVNRDMTVISSS